MKCKAGSAGNSRNNSQNQKITQKFLNKNFEVNGCITQNRMEQYSYQPRLNHLINPNKKIVVTKKKTSLDEFRMKLKTNSFFKILKFEN